MGIELTREQQAAVADSGGALLVAAAAGSGKTRVLVERLFRHIAQGADVDEFLIITYTRAAAAELRGKIAEELSRRLAQTPEDAHLRRQLYRVYQADIRTVDAFCGALLRENIHLLKPVKGHSLTPDFRVLDQQEAALLRQRVLERVLEQFYETMDAQDEQLAQTLGAGRSDRALAELVLEVYEKTRSHPYPQEWLAEMRSRWETLPASLSESDYGRVLMDDTVRRASFWSAQLRREAGRMAVQPELERGYADRFLETAAQLEQYRTAAGSWTAMAAVKPGFRTMGRAPDSPEKRRAQALLRRCREELKKLTALYEVPQEAYLADLAAMAPAMLSLIRLEERFADACQAEKARRNAVDFSDQEHGAIALLLDAEGRPTELAQRIARRYREIMVDEFQDSNAVQDCIFQAVSRQGRNLFTVGDVKQSIYRFRLADPGIFLRRYLSYRDAAEAAEGEPRRVLLGRNFRSRRSVLDAANFIFGSIMSREMGEMAYGEEERLRFGASSYLPRQDDATEYHLVSVEDTEEEKRDRTAVEASFVARRIRRLLDEGFPVQEGEGFRPCRAEDIVILMRSPRARLQAFSAALAAVGIPCSAQEDASFFDMAEIAAVYSLLQVVDNPRQDVPLIAVLRSPLFAFTADDLARIRALSPSGDFYDALLLDDSARTVRFLRLLGELRKAAREEPADALLWRAYDSCQAMAVFGAMAGGEARRSRLEAFYAYARQMASAGRRSLFDFVTHLQQLLQRGDAPALSAHQTGGGVQIMSIHSAKGLEFPIVLLCDLHKAFNDEDVRRPVLVHPALGLGTELVDTQRHIRYDTVTKTAVAQQLLRESRAEEMRILYVAMTRAKEKLILVQCMKSARRRLQDLSGMAGSPVAPQAVASGRCFGDWILLPLLHTPEAAALRQWAELPGGEPVSGAEGWTVRLWENPDGGAPAAAAQAAPETAQQPVFDRAALEWSYPHLHSTVVPTKVTATQLKGREWDEEIRGDAARPPRPGDFGKPRFLQGEGTLSGAQRGTAVHLVMQYIDFSLPPTEAAVAEAVAALRERRLLTAPQAEAVDARLIADFLASPLCRRIRGAQRLYREYRFNLLTDAAVYDRAAAGEQIMLQGVVDCAFSTPEGLVVVDFKTDRITPEQAAERTEYYRPQLEAYAMALSRVLEQPVCEKILYFFHIKTAVTL